MRNVILTPLLLSLSGFTRSQSTVPFILPQHDDLPKDNVILSSDDTSPAHIFELSKRATSCKNGYLSCDYMNVSGYCCPTNAQCAVDPVGHVACCPIGAVCTGIVTNGGFATLLNTASTTQTSSMTGTGTGTGTSSPVTAAPAVPASFIQNAGTTSVSGSIAVLSNPYFAYPIIATTYANAAGCSAAWTACQTDLAKCTSFLAPSAAGASVTISAPNFVTSAAATTYALITAQAICTSLSSLACSGLSVSACTVFDGVKGAAAPTGCAGVYVAGVGAMVGVAGGGMLWG
jgi:hypothetical protein